MRTLDISAAELAVIGGGIAACIIGAFAFDAFGGWFSGGLCLAGAATAALTGWQVVNRPI